METRRGPLTTSILRYPFCGHSHQRDFQHGFKGSQGIISPNEWPKFPSHARGRATTNRNSPKRWPLCSSRTLVLIASWIWS